jgi:hypothetical protein
MVCQLPRIRNLFFVSRINTGDDRSLYIASLGVVCVTSAERKRKMDRYNNLDEKKKGARPTKKDKNGRVRPCRRHTHVDIASQRPRK